MFLRRQSMSSLAVVFLLASVAFFLARRGLPPASMNPEPQDGDARRAEESSEPAPVADSAPIPTFPVPAEDEWANRWQEWNAHSIGPERDRQIAALLEELAVTEPKRALSLADAETNPDLRVDCLQAALRGWGGVNPEAAIAWANSQTLLDRGQAMSVVFHGAARDPENALRLTRLWSRQDPERAGDFGSYLVAALARVGEFGKAADFAADTPADLRVDLLNAAYARWAEREPQAAMNHIGELSDPEKHRTAFDATVSSWAHQDPKALAEYSLNLSDERERAFAVAAALQTWAVSAAPEAAAWINRFEPSPELDRGTAIVALLPETLRQPPLATSWAERIVDPHLRVRVLAAIVNEWATTDRAAARAYAVNSPHIQTEERAGVLAAFDPDFSPISLSP
jgi:hypothetical protein